MRGLRGLAGFPRFKGLDSTSCGARRGTSCGPRCGARVKTGSLRLDADVLAWLKKDGQGYQTRANQMLRERMLKDLEGR